MTLHTFQRVVRQVERTLPCNQCGKALKRSFRGEATYNPFNDGNPPEQALASAERTAARAEAEGVICRDCAEKPYREALLAFADGQDLPERAWNNVTDILLDRNNIEEVVDRSPCPTCCQHQWKLLGYRLTDKGKRIVDRLRDASRVDSAHA